MLQDHNNICVTKRYVINKYSYHCNIRNCYICQLSISVLLLYLYTFAFIKIRLLKCVKSVLLL